jgi:hypothetical protein
MGADGGNGKRGSAERLEWSHGLVSPLSVLLSSALLWRTDPPCTISKRNGKDDKIATDCKKPRWIARSGEQVAFRPFASCATVRCKRASS